MIVLHKLFQTVENHYQPSHDSSDSIESQRTRIFCSAGSPASEVKVPFTIVSSQVVIKVVFGEVLTRDEAFGIVKSKFSVKQNNLTNLTPSQVMSVLVKKLVKHKYVTLKENVSSLSDATVHKEIAGVILGQSNPIPGVMLGQSNLIVGVILG